MKKIVRLLILNLAFCFLLSSAQPPQAIPYQAVVRSNSGAIMPNKFISLRFKIHESTPNGVILYSEKHNGNTNLFGLISVTIGRGNQLSGNFDSIPWQTNDKFLQVEIDTAGGTNYTDMGTTQMLSVPYALFARSAGYADSTNFSGILYNKEFMMIDSSGGTSSSDTVFRVDKKGKSIHKGREFFFRGLIIRFDTLMIVDTLGNPVFAVYPDGSSYHKGVETFAGGIVVGDTNKTHMFVLPDGSFQVVDSLGNPLFAIAANGDSYHQGIETFASGTYFGNPDSAHVLINPDGSIQCVNSQGKVIFSVDSSGDSYHAGRETFASTTIFGPATPDNSFVKISPFGNIQIIDHNGHTRLFIDSQGGISCQDGDGNLMYRFSSDGTSFHSGLESYIGGIEVGQSSDSKCTIGADGSIQIKDSTGKVVFSVAADGTSTHAGHETFTDGITVGKLGSMKFEVKPNTGITLKDSLNNTVFELKPDGTSVHKGLESFEGGIKAGAFGNFVVGEDGYLELKTDDGTVLFSIDSDGKSYHKGEETFDGGIVVGKLQGPSIVLQKNGSIIVSDSTNATAFAVYPDGTSYHKGVETFDSAPVFRQGATFGNGLNSKFEVGSDGSIRLKDANGNVVYSVNQYGFSDHYQRETFHNGITIGTITPTSSFVDIEPNGTIKFLGPGGTVLFKVDTNGNSIHGGHESFYGGISVYNTDVSVNGTGTISGNGSGIYNMNASNLSTGIVNDVLLSTNVVRTNSANTFNQTQTTMPFAPGSDAVVGVAPGQSPGPSSGKAGKFYGDGEFTGAVTASAFILNPGGPITLIGNGSQITDLNASSLATGTVPDERLSPSVIRTNTPNVYSQTQTMMPVTPGNDALVAVAPGQVAGPSSNKAGMFYGDGAFTGALTATTLSGNGSALTNLNASTVSTGILSDLRLSVNIPRRNSVNTFTQPQNVNINSLATALQSTNTGGGPAAVFNGDVQVNGTLSKSAGSFKIDHPLDPQNKYLSHSFVESPDMMNIYNGNITLDKNGKATIELPDWFGALNKDFRYQLTAIGASGPDLYVAEEVTDNHFKIAGGKPSMKVSWMVTGIRHDAYAEKYPIEVEKEKSEKDRGTYMHPEVFINK